MQRLLILAAFLALSTSAAVHAQSPLVQIVRVRRTQGDGDVELFRRAFTRSLNAIRYCHERRLAQGVRIQGRLAMTIVVTPDARLHAEVRERTFEQDAELETCMLRMAERIRVPAQTSSTFLVRLVLRAPPAPEVTTDIETARAEAEATRTESRCLARAAARLTRLLAAWDRAGPAQRERLTPQIAEARGAATTCRGLLGLFGGGIGRPLGCGPEVCGNLVDDDCNGAIDDGCLIGPGRCQGCLGDS